jgi:hypothetical protein
VATALRSGRLALATAFVALLATCQGSAAGDASGDARDAGDLAQADPGPWPGDDDATPFLTDPGGTDADGTLDALGFRIRVPRQHQVPTEGPGGQTGFTELWDQDWVCTLRHDGVDATVYARFEPLKDKGLVFGGAVYQSDGAWVSSGGVVTPAIASYDAGGNHQNDWMLVTWGGATVRYYHSSFDGAAWRKCQPMDCLQVLAADGVTFAENGCTSDRTLPVVCVVVAQDGTVPDLTDHFAPCPDGGE